MNTCFVVFETFSKTHKISARWRNHFGNDSVIAAYVLGQPRFMTASFHDIDLKQNMCFDLLSSQFYCYNFNALEMTK